MGSGERAGPHPSLLSTATATGATALSNTTSSSARGFEAKGDIEARLTELQDATVWMPQDRMFPGLARLEGVATPADDLKQFLDLLEQLQ